VQAVVPVVACGVLEQERITA